MSDDVLLDIQEKITADIKSQLEKSPSDRTRMLPTFVDKLPTGSESGDFLVLDFGGHFFRVAYVNIKKSEKILNSEQQIRIDQRRLTIRNWPICKCNPRVTSHIKWVVYCDFQRKFQGIIESNERPFNDSNLIDLVSKSGKHSDDREERVFMESAVYPLRQKILDSQGFNINVEMALSELSPKMEGPEK